ncbi:uncharacterized protein LOC111333422 [Stylophora pistillata]|uniref:uncharacterized protein LOC111333422 n=1 Tax=Stylophora pistillata TaxID=50429 RepID=UPI000C0529C5|nr:uncharacterized protein LOC111333422 [Stylophora pistillata]
MDTNWDANFPELLRVCDHEYAREVKFIQPELRYAAKALETKPIFALEIPYPLLREWHKMITEDTSETTKGRAREALNDRVKKSVHIFEGQESEINEWRTKNKNIEQEKEELFKEMTQTIEEKDRVISYLQNTNKQLEEYLVYLEKLSINAEFKGKPVSSSQNKARKLKNFLTRAETALWFSKYFELDIKRILVKESDSGVKHTLSIKKILPCDLAGPNEQATTLKYNSLSEEEKKQVEEILFLLDKFCVGDSFVHELTMVTDGLPKSYLIQQCRANLNKLCHIDSLLGKAPEAKVSAVKELIKEHVVEYLRENPATEKIQININGDGARMTRNSSFVLLSFSILQTGHQVMTAKGNRTLAILNGKEDYTSLKESFGNIFSEINCIITEAKVTVGHTEIKTEFFLGGDYKFILIMLGLNGATANYACAWCKFHKDDRWNTDEHFT